MGRTSEVLERHKIANKRHKVKMQNLIISVTKIMRQKILNLKKRIERTPSLS